MTSPDGVSWTVQFYGRPYELYGVTYGNRTFVAVGGCTDSDDPCGGTILQSDPFFPVTVTSTTPSGYYKAGSDIDITLNFAEPVSSAGLTITLNTGASIVTGSFSNETSYSVVYTVESGQNATLLTSALLDSTNAAGYGLLFFTTKYEFEDDSQTPAAVW
jgi:hypothetical protein